MKQEPIENVEWYERTYSLKVRDGVYAWIYDHDGSERFPNVTFSTQNEAQEYVDRMYGRTYVKFIKNDES